MAILDLRDLNLSNKRILIRADLNVPMQDGVITGDQRIRAILPTIDHCLRAAAKVMLVSHLGRPQEGHPEPKLSLKPIVDYLSNHYQQPIPLIANWLEQSFPINNGQLVVLENCRFNRGEMSNNDALSKQIASLCEIFVMDAFGTAHRAQATTHGVAKYAPIACAGPLLIEELRAINNALKKAKPPIVALVGGSKISTKLDILESLANKVDHLIVGGGIANSFLLATGASVGRSICEQGLIETAQSLITTMHKRNAHIPIARDVRVAKHFSKDARAITKDVDGIQPDDMILDLGPKSVDYLCKIIATAGTIIWNGPIGVFEFPAFAEGTHRVAQAIAASQAFSIAGGGDTLAAIDSFHLAAKISYISTGGGAFLELLGGKTLPSVAILEQRAES